MRRALQGMILVVAATAACRTVSTSGSQSMSDARRDPAERGRERSPKNEKKNDKEKVEAAPPQEKPLPPPPEVAPRWGKLPETSGELFSVIDGACRGLSLHAVADAMLVSYATDDKPVVARITDDGVEKLPGPRAAKDQPSIHNIHAIVGRWPDALWLEYDDGGRCTYREGAVHLAGNVWKPAFDLGAFDSVSDIKPYKEGALAQHSCMDGCGSPDPSSKCVPATMWSDGLHRTPPVALGGAFRLSTFAVLASGEIFAVGGACSHTSPSPCTTSELRWWSANENGGKVRSVAFPTSTDGGPTRMLARTPTDVIVTQGRAIRAFDGTKIKSVATSPVEIYGIFDRGAEGVWLVADDKLLALDPSGAFTDITPPKEGKQSRLGVSAMGDVAWATHGDGLYRRESGTWKKVALPRPPFSSTSAYLTPEQVHVRGPGDVWVTASYHEQQPGWNEPEKRLTILRTKRPKQTLRCRLEPNGYDSMFGGFIGWPAPMRDECTTPFVVLAAVSPSSPKTNDYPKTRALMKPHLAQIPGGALSEVHADDMTWIGVRASTPEAARQIAATYARSFPMAHTEAVCADVSDSRAIPIDPKAPRDPKDGGS
jgi:hypothetical protein